MRPLAGILLLSLIGPATAQQGADPLRVGVLLLEGVYNSELVAPLDVFHHTAAHARPGMRVFTVGRSREPVRSYEGLRITPDHALDDAPSIDVLVVPSGKHSMTSDLDDDRLVDWVGKRGRAARHVLSVCDGAFVLARAGLLDGHRCTTYPGDIAALREGFPKLDVVENVNFVVDRKVITGAGGAESYAPALYLVETLLGRDVARRVGKGLVIDWDLARVTHVVAGRPAAAAADPASFAEYWFAGLAEISRFDLSASRYGQDRRGHAVLVFVTEDFRRDRQVKAETRPRDAGLVVPVLKLNHIERFTTGIYDYSMMRSVFSPLTAKGAPALKVSASIQDWCGHVWSQLNNRGDELQLTGHSYFEAEADERATLPAAPLEDEVWTLLRRGPEHLPVGEVRMIPGTFDARLRHRPQRVQNARAALEPAPAVDGRECLRYSVRYSALGRGLSITFEKALPHRILAWEEDLGGGRVTRAVRTHMRRSAYWNESSTASDGLRATLGLPRGGARD